MDISVPPGTYVVAVSGGVDSMVLLDVLTKVPDLRLIVAHYDHGIRDDAKDDRLLVQQKAKDYKLPFVYDEGHLGIHVSEAKAREARHAFLRKVRRATGAQAIITAHHEDDVIETAIINLMRGTNRRGLASLHAYSDIIRPLLHKNKEEIRDYATDHNLTWHEDSTNQDVRYLRNYIRHKIIPRFSKEEQQQFLSHINNAGQLNKDIDRLLINHLHISPASDTLDRHYIIMLPHAVAREVFASWLRYRRITDVDKKMLEKLVVAAKTYQPGKRASVDKDHYLLITKSKLALIPTS